MQMEMMFLNFLVNNKNTIFVLLPKLKIMFTSSVLLGFVGPWEIVIIVLVIVLIFGGRKIPELMRGLGQGMKEFKNASKEENSENEEPKK